jgi:hypothetical protein
VGIVPRDTQAGKNADYLERAFTEQRSRLSELGSEQERSRRAQALDHMANYVVLLREAAAGTSPDRGRGSLPAFSFKVEFEDGCWSIEEKELASPPQVGDTISFAEGGSWRVRATQLVGVRPEGKPARSFFVCAPLPSASA